MPVGRSRTVDEPTQGGRRAHLIVAAVLVARLGSRLDAPPRGTGRHAPVRRHRRPRRRVLRRRGRSDLRLDRPERRRQDDRLQRDHAAVQAGLGRGDARRRVAPEAAGVSNRGQGRRTHVPEPPALSHDVGARERAHRGARPRPHGRREGGVRDARRRRPPRARALPRGGAPLRGPEARRARASARREAAPPAPRRARGWSEQRGGLRARHVHPEAPHTTST